MSCCECTLCNEIHTGTLDKTLNSRLLQETFPKGRLIHETENWMTIPSLGSFCEGYLLCINRQHYRSLSACTVEETENLHKLLSSIENVFVKSYGSKISYFEHGVVDEGYISASCIDHVHLHILPQRDCMWKRIEPFIQSRYFVLETLLQLKEILKLRNMKSYLLFRDADATIYLIDASEDVYPSQFFRMLIFGILTGEKSRGWDWRSQYHVENMRKTYDTLKGKL